MLAATTLPRAVIDIGGHQLIGWAFSLYQLGSILAGAATALLVVRFGLRVSLLGAASVYGVGSCLCAIAADMPTLLVGRLLQGLGGGGLVALNYVALSRLFPNALLPRLIALTSAIWSVSAFCGPLIGGSFASVGLWRMAFWAFAAQALAMLVLAVKLLPDESPETTPGGGFPGLRLTLLAAAILLVSAAGAEIDLLVSPLLGMAGILLLWLFIQLDMGTSRQHMFPRGVLHLNTPVGAGLLMVFAASAATMSFLVYGAFLLDVLHAVDPLTAGYILAMESVAWGVAALVFARAPLALERWLIRAGVAIVTLGVLGLTVFMRSGELWMIVPWPVCQGAGFGMMWGFVVRRVVAGAAGQEQASSALPTTQQIGFAVGAAACGIVANAVGFADGVSADAAAGVAIWVFAAFLPVMAFANVAAWRFTVNN